MMRKRMLGLWFTLLLIFLATNGFCGNGFNVALNSEDSPTLMLSFTLEDYAIKTLDDGQQVYSFVDFQDGVKTSKKGYAELPFIHASVALPSIGNPQLEVVSSSFVDIPLDYPMLPSKGVIYRNQDPESVAYETAPESIADQWYPETLTEATEPFIFKETRGINVYVYPFRYNAATQMLRIYENVEVRVHINTTETYNPLPQTYNKTALPVMDAIYSSIFINYLSEAAVYAPDIGEIGDILVLYTQRDADAIAPYVQWKREKGFTVYTQQVATGTNVKNIIKQQYNSHPNILYVQLVGDWEDIKSDLGTGDNAPMDPMLGCVSGNDNYPDIAIGRFSANSAAQVSVQVNKVINYEKNPDPNGNWYDTGLGIGSGEGASAGDDGEADYVHIDLIKQHKLLPFTYSDVKEIYQSGSAAAVSSYVSNGLSLINYCGHGSDTSWATTGFNTSDISSLSNGNKLPVIFSVACINGTFHKSGTCFAEAWLRHENGGAVAAVMSTINQPWQPPMRGQDYMNDLLTGGYNYSLNPGNGTNTDKGRTTVGSIVLNSLVLMYAESSASADLETIQTWTTFGDASLQVRTREPELIQVSNTSVSTGTPFSTTVTSNQGAVSGAMVSLHQNGQVFSGTTDTSGQITINHALSAGSATLVVSGFNLETKYEQIMVNGGVVPLTAQFSGSPTSGTTPLNVQFSDQSSGNPTSWSWDFGDGTTSQEQNPSHQYTAVGNYTVTLTVANSNGSDLETKNNYITVSDSSGTYCEAQASNNTYEYIQKVAIGSFSNTSEASGYSDFTAQVIDMTPGRGDTVTLTPGFSELAYSENWNIWIDLNKDSDFDDPGENVFQDSGYSDVTGTITIPQGTASGTTRMRIAMQYYSYADPCGTFQYGEVEDYTVNITGGGQSPKAAISASPTSGPAPLTVQFTDQSSGMPTSWSWDFGDGSTSKEQNPSHQYTTAGNYTVTLTVNNENGSDSQTKSNYVTVSDTSNNYCEAKATNYSYEFIQQIAIGSFTNSSTASGYSDFTSQTIDMSPGADYTVTLTPGFSGLAYNENWRIWIDLNNDGDFDDPGENVFQDSSNSDVTGTITIPQGTASGTTRIRIAMRYYSYADPCGTFQYGEVEDYSIKIN